MEETAEICSWGTETCERPAKTKILNMKVENPFGLKIPRKCKLHEADKIILCPICIPNGSLHYWCNVAWPHLADESHQVFESKRA